MIEQTRIPYEWTIVDDDSSDNTAEIVSRYAAQYPWIKLVKKQRREHQGDRQRGKGVVETFYFGYDRLKRSDYDFLVKLDGDLAFQSELLCVSSREVCQ